MKQSIQRLAFLVLLTGVLALPAASTEEYLRWRTADERVDADIHTWDLLTLLNKISSATGWEIFLEPGTKYSVSAKFTNAPPSEALRLLLGKLNYALLPQAEAAPKFYVFRSGISAATQRVAAEPAAEDKNKHLLRKELIVTVAPGTDIEELARQLGAKIVGRIDDLNTYRLEFDSEAAAQTAREELSRNSNVTEIDSNFVVERNPSAQMLPTDMVSTRPFSLTFNPDADQVIIGLVDSHVQSLGPEMDAFILKALSLAGDPKSDGLSHGTSMASTILQVLAAIAEKEGSSSVRILPIDIYGNRTSTTTFDVANGIYEAARNGASIINLSLGTTGDSQFLYRTVQQFSSQGGLVFAAAGNQPGTDVNYPARYSEVIAVSAQANYAKSGPFVDIVAPDQTIVKQENKAYGVRGTSVSSAAASGMAAGIADVSKEPLARVKEAVLTHPATQPKKGN